VLASVFRCGAPCRSRSSRPGRRRSAACRDGGDFEALWWLDEVERIAFVRLDDRAVLDDFGAVAVAAQHVLAGRPMKE
jgi:hypothetical protein